VSSMKAFGIRKCERCGTWLIVRLYARRKQCPNCGRQMLVKPKRRRLSEVYVAFAETLREAHELLKTMKGTVRELKK